MNFEVRAIAYVHNFRIYVYWKRGAISYVSQTKYNVTAISILKGFFIR